MHYIKTNNLILLQAVLKCTYGPNTIKLNALWYSVNLIRNHISMTTTAKKKMKHVFTVIACRAALAIIWKCCIIERGKYERRR